VSPISESNLTQDLPALQRKVVRGLASGGEAPSLQELTQSRKTVIITALSVRPMNTSQLRAQLRPYGITGSEQLKKILEELKGERRIRAKRINRKERVWMVVPQVLQVGGPARIRNPGMSPAEVREGSALTLKSYGVFAALLDSLEEVLPPDFSQQFSRMAGWNLGEWAAQQLANQRNMLGALYNANNAAFMRGWQDFLNSHGQLQLGLSKAEERAWLNHLRENFPRD